MTNFIKNSPELNGIVVNQNQKPTGSITADGLWRYQEFFLPTNYTRGSSDDEIVIPPLSGLQLMLGITDATAASVDWTLEHYVLGTGWTQFTSGTATGAHAVGDHVWMDIFFDDAVMITEDLLSARFRIGRKLNAGISKAWYTTPNPFAAIFAKAYQADGTTVIQSAGQDIAFCFRVLALSADEGVDFLGNAYRSAVVSSNLDDMSRLNGNPDAGWMSSPFPSRFAVTNLYFDVRPPVATQYELNPNYIGPYTNTVTNPSFEVSVANWITSLGAFMASGATLTQDATNFLFGTKSGKVVTTNASGSQGAENLLSGTFLAGVKYTFSIYLKGNAGGESVEVILGDSGGDIAPIGFFTLTNAWARYAVEWTPSANRTGGFVNVVSNGAAAYTWFMDGAMVVQSPIASNPSYFDGSFPGSVWNGTAGLSTSSHAAIGDQYIPAPGSISDSESVIDKVLLDPLTPGVYFNVYWSSEGDPGTDDADWDNKLWNHVPRTYQAVKRESHVLPEPITTKYLKIEFSHLQAQSYNPGDLARPVGYKKHPKWVLDYFLARTSAEKAATNGLLAGTVSVIYDALDLAYNYYLDDLAQEPDKPAEIDPSYTAKVTQFIEDKSDLSDQVDPTTLTKINLALAPYQQHPSVFSKDDYLLGAYSKQTAASLDYPSEGSDAPDFPDVRELRSESVIFESDFPVMFFYLTCRHKYREVIAGFSHNRAYFAGVREIAFTRENFAVANDGTDYQDPGADFVNAARNDFTRIEGQMVIA